MKPDNKASRRKIIQSEECRQYKHAQRHKYDMQKNLDRLGYRSPEEYRDTVSYLAW